MTKRDRITTYVAALLIGVYIGYSIHQKASTESVTQQNNITTRETTTTVTNAKGTTKTTTKRDIIDKTKIEKELVIMPRKSVLNLSALATVDPKAGRYVPIYGISVTKEVFGPFTAGAFGLTNGTLGLSVGINF